jgi:uncharacterized protein (TIGR01777 family)
MRIVLAGATGFLGGLLRRRLGPAHDLVMLTRAPSGTPGITEVEWRPDGTAGAWARALDGVDAVINLAGAPLVGPRWSPARKAALVASRVEPTRSLVAAIERAAARPRVLISASAVGYYGPHGDDVLTEDSPAGHDFLASICVQWENAALGAEALGTRVVTIRTGLPLSAEGGALKPMLLPFRLGLGGPFGSGSQYWPWIHADDWSGLVEFLLAQPTVSGAVNLTAPTPVTNATFARTLGKVLRRPAIVPAPRMALRAALGEVADALLLSGQRAEPKRALALGYTFAYSNLETALRQILRG